MASFDPLGDRHGVSGYWSGHYQYDSLLQAGRTCPVAATLWEVRGRIEGVMSDGLTHSAYSLRKVLDNADAMGKISAVVFEAMLRRHPGTTVEMSLPTDSVLRGRLRGDTLRFTKTYEGACTTRFLDAGWTLASVVSRHHRVHYSGVFDVARGVIEGTWEIRHPGPFGRFLPRRGTGTFFLARDDNSG
jgi:hypothetical protein